jgi:Na+/alanine symporter
MEFSTFALIAFGVLTIVNIICAIVLYPELREVVKEFKRE